jgi:homocysteine S-methyltransferase
MKTLNTQINEYTFLTDGGLETDLIFKRNIDLPHFAAFPLLDDPALSHVLEDYYREYLDIAGQHHTGFILESPTWRANTDWGYKLGYDENELIRINQKAIAALKKLRESYVEAIEPIVISGQIGPRGDGYESDTNMTSDEAGTYHSLQVKSFHEAGADMVSAITMTYTEEAIGISREAKRLKLPVVISFTVETDGRLPNGDHLKDAIRKVDLATGGYPLYYMINCAHPSHFFEVLEGDRDSVSRIKGIRANASCKSQAELNDSTELDSGDPEDLAQWHGKLIRLLPELRVFGGCCGTDASHVSSICRHLISEQDMQDAGLKS